MQRKFIWMVIFIVIMVGLLTVSGCSISKEAHDDKCCKKENVEQTNETKLPLRITKESKPVIKQ